MDIKEFSDALHSALQGSFSLKSPQILDFFEYVRSSKDNLQNLIGLPIPDDFDQSMKWLKLVCRQFGLKLKSKQMWTGKIQIRVYTIINKISNIPQKTTDIQEIIEDLKKKLQQQVKTIAILQKEVSRLSGENKELFLEVTKLKKHTSTKYGKEVKEEIIAHAVKMIENGTPKVVAAKELSQEFDVKAETIRWWLKALK